MVCCFNEFEYRKCMAARSETEQSNRNVMGSKCYSPRTIFALLIVSVCVQLVRIHKISLNAFTAHDLSIDYCIVSINRMEDNWLGNGDSVIPKRQQLQIIKA